jgi:GNAT superfamily N-acetyltransferase
VLIRAASPLDAPGIAVVQRESWLAAYDGIIERSAIERIMVPDGGARVRQSFRTRPWQRMIVAVAAEPDTPGVVGYASYGPEVDVLGARWPHPRTAAGERGEIAELYALYVLPAWWSTGTGRALMDRVLARTARAGYTSITLWVLRDNARARRFYQRAGFAPDGATNVLDGLGGVTEVRYRRPLPPP